MAFLDTLGKKLTQTGQEVVQKTKDTAEVLKYSGMISDEERKINEFYIQIGKLYIDLYSGSYDATFTEMIAAIKESQAKIAEYKEHIIQVKGVFSCPNCGEELPLNVAFCSSCGTKIEKQDATIPNTNIRYCQDCGTPLQAGYVFCINCGAKYETPDASPVNESTIEESITEDSTTEEVFSE